MQLELSGPEADNSRLQLENYITDVLVTRNWFTHGLNRTTYGLNRTTYGLNRTTYGHSLSVTQVVRAMASLLGIISKLGCDPASVQVASDSITASIAHVHESELPGRPVTLTMACLFYTRALRRLCKVMNVDDISKEALHCTWPNRHQEIQLFMDCVWDGWCYLYHVKCNRKSMALLVRICAVSRLLRSPPMGDRWATVAQ